MRVRWQSNVILTSGKRQWADCLHQHQKAVLGQELFAFRRQFAVCRRPDNNIPGKIYNNVLPHFTRLQLIQQLVLYALVRWKSCILCYACLAGPMSFPYTQSAAMRTCSISLLLRQMFRSDSSSFALCTHAYSRRSQHSCATSMMLAPIVSQLSTLNGSVLVAHT